MLVSLSLGVADLSGGNHPFVFFFDLCCSHGDLHSLPTRRSSDLLAAGSRSARREECGFLPSRCAGRARHRGRWDRRNPHSDRKSTRLNSSHANSSYAVFCWKKKELCTGDIQRRGFSKSSSSRQTE